MKRLYSVTALAVAAFFNMQANVADEINRYNRLVFLAYSTTESTGSTKQLVETFKKLSAKPTYRNAGIFFLSAGQANAQEMEQFNVTKLPAVVIFKRGKVAEFGGNRAILYGYSSSVELEDFVEHWLSDVINQTETTYDDYYDTNYDDDNYDNNGNVYVYHDYTPYYGYGSPYFWGGYGYGWPYRGLGWGGYGRRWRGRGHHGGWSGRGGRGWSGGRRHSGGGHGHRSGAARVGGRGGGGRRGGRR